MEETLPSALKFKKTSFILLTITLYGVNYFLFERVFFFNELLSAIGLYYFIKHSFNKDFTKLEYPRSTIYKYVLLFILLCSFYAIVSLWLKTSWYYYFRNLSILYSVFGFFIGYYLYEEQFRFFSKIKGAIYGYALLCFAWGAPGIIDRNAYSFWFALLQKNWRLASVLLFVLLFILYVVSYTSLTVIIILMVVLGMRFFLRSYLQFKIVVLVVMIGFSVLFTQAIPFLKLYSYDDYALFGNVHYVYAHHPWFSIDHNSSWRLIFWYRTVIETFPQCLWGIGIGTPLLPYLPNVTTTELNFSDEYIAHVIGTHNTFITIIVRFGILSILLMGVIYRSVFREFFLFKKFYIANKNDLGLFLGFITLSTVGIFNLLLETPTLSVLYWVSLGFVAKAIYNRQTKNYRMQNM